MMPLEARIGALENDLSRYRSGNLPEADFRALRLQYGISGSRNGTYGLRLHPHLGAIHSPEFFRLADAANRFGDGTLRILPRQGMEFLGVSLGRLLPLYRFLANKISRFPIGSPAAMDAAHCCPRSGFCANQAFDIRALLQQEGNRGSEAGSHSGSSLKIAFSGCGNDCGMAALSDLGFIAAMLDGRPGFRVYAHSHPRVPQPRSLKLFDWVPSESVPGIIRALEEIRADLGSGPEGPGSEVSDLAESIGLERFRALVASRLGEEADAIREPHEEDGSVPAGGPAPTGPDPKVSSKFQVFRQVEEDYYSLRITPPLGILDQDGLQGIIDTLIGNPSLEIRLGFRRDFFLCDIPGPRISRIIKTLLPAAILGRIKDLSHVICCQGPEACAAALCNAPGLARSLIAAIKADEALSRLGNIPIHVDGCPTNCTRHRSAGIGFSGSLQHILGKPAPCYDVWLGGTVRENGTRPAIHVGKLPVARVIPWLRDFLAPVAEGGDAFLDYIHAQEGLQKAADLIRSHLAEATRNRLSYSLFTDLEMSASFSPPFSAKFRAEGYRRDPATHRVNRILSLRRKLAEVTGKSEREAMLAAIFRESCLALAHILGLQAEPENIPMEAIERALASSGSEPAAEGLSILDTALRHGKRLAPYRKEILNLSHHVEMLFQSARPGRV